jgi:lipooligosaccharide transport system ATP-binding protein
MDEAEQLCDRLVVMDEARIVAEGSPAGLIAEHSTKEVVELRFADPESRGQALPFARRLGRRVEVLTERVLVYADDGDAALTALHADGVSPISVLVRRSSLEDVFLHLTGREIVE